MRTDHGLTRRQFLRGAGVAISLPYFPSLHAGVAGADAAKPPVRLMYMCVPLGFVPNKYLFDCPVFQDAGNKGWFPEIDGALTAMPPVHGSLQPFSQHLSFLKGLCNRKYRGEIHGADNTFLTCADTLADPTRSFANSISCDQIAAGSNVLGGDDVRHRHLALGVSVGASSMSGGLSWSANGSPITPLTSPAKVFDLLFGKDDVPTAVRLQRLQQKKSFLDVTLGQVQDLDRRLNAADRTKLDEVLTAVHDVEANIQREEKWLGVDKPSTTIARPDETITGYSVNHARTMLALVHAAFLTDSTRVVTYQMPASFSEVSPTPKHQLNHPGSADSIRVDHAMSEQLAIFAKNLCDSADHDGQPLMQHCLAAYGAALWGANHSLHSLPIMLMGHGGGRIRQGMSHKFAEDTPLANLWLTMLDAAGVKAPNGSFGDSTGLLTELMQ